MPFYARFAFRRRTAWLVLAAWLFALASGVANACLLTRSPLGPPGNGGDGYHVVHHGALTTNASSAERDSPDGHEDGVHTPCQRFCDEEATTIKQADPVGATGPLALCSLGSWLILPAADHRLTWSPERALPPDIPAAIRFQRLTI